MLNTLNTIIIPQNPYDSLEYQDHWINSTDALSVSCCRYRLKNMAVVSANQITDQDRNQAMNIRHYYSGKLMNMVLRNIPLSRFRQDLADYVNMPTNSIPSKDQQGMIYRLPEMYDYDTLLDQAIERFDADTRPNRLMITHTSKWDLNLLPGFNFTRAIRSQPKKTNLYWMLDSRTNRMVKLGFYVDNPLLGLWDELWTRNIQQGTPIEVTAHIKHSHFDTFHHVSINQLIGVR